MKKGSKYCICRSTGRRTINNMGDDFVLLHEPHENEKWRIGAEQGKSFLLLKINFCPMCGRKLKKKGK